MKTAGCLKLRLAMVIPMVIGVWLLLSGSPASSADPKVRIHVPSKSLSIMPYYFGKDKGFFAAEQIDPQLIIMAPPTAIAALVAGELDFSATTGAATSAIMRGLPLRRVFYVQQDPVHMLLAQPEIKSIQDLVGKAVGVNGIDGCRGHVGQRDSARQWDRSRESHVAGHAGDRQCDQIAHDEESCRELLAPPYVEELEVKGYVRMAEARTYAPLSFIGMVSSHGNYEEKSAESLRHDLRATSNHELHPQSRQSSRSCSIRFDVSQDRSVLGGKIFGRADAGLQQRRHQAARGGRKRDRDLPRVAEDREDFHAR